MSVRRYGIYLFYQPHVDLRVQGLGRQLAAFLLAAEKRADVSFVIACPSWMRGTLKSLCDDAGANFQALQILAPAGSPILLRLLNILGRMHRSRRGRAWLNRSTAWPRRGPGRMGTWAAANLARTRSGLVFATATLAAAASILALASIWRLFAFVRAQLRRILAPVRSRVVAFLRDVRSDPAILKLYHHMETAEVQLLHELIAERSDIVAWYCPAAFWPHFNDIAAPRLMSVPDMVPVECPIGFAKLARGEQFEQSFQRLETAVGGSHYLVTYSEHVKCKTLVERYQVDPERIEVIPHGANDLSPLLPFSGMKDDGGTHGTGYCLTLFRSALHKAVNCERACTYGSGDVRFLFYASQLRPNKNVLTLLRAYEWLLRRQAISHKLILTASPHEFPSVREFVAEKGLENDVLFLYGLSERELAACYRLADLAVNPSLSEGGFPFTFAEAVSVGTPVVMASIPVTTEYLGSAPVASSMLFDPYDWRALADRIAWALANRQALYRAQREFFDETVATRTWGDVVDDHIRALDRISRVQQRAEADKLRVPA